VALRNQQPARFFDLPFLLRTFIAAIVIECISLPPAILTMGHAGPEGPFAAFGWIGAAINLPGLIIAGGLAPFSTVWQFSACVLIVQVVLIFVLLSGIRWLRLRWL